MRAKNIAYIILLIIAFLLAMSAFTPSWGQQTQTAGNATSNYKILGRLMADSVVKVPTVFKIYHYAGWDSTGSLAVVGGVFYYHNGLIWKTPGSSSFDSTFIYAALADTAAVLRALIRADTGYVPYVGATRNFTTNFGVTSYTDTVYNKAATTGVTNFVIKQGAGQLSNPVMQILNTTGGELLSFKTDVGGSLNLFGGLITFGLSSGVSPVIDIFSVSSKGMTITQLTGDYINGSDVAFQWTDGNPQTGIVNLGLSRISNGLLGVGNGTHGNFSGNARMNRLIANSIAMPGSTSGTLTVTPAAITTSYTWVYPNGAGTSGQVLTTDGTGITSWFTPSFGLGTVTSVGLVAGTGTSIAGSSPITTSGTFTVTNTAPDQTVVLNNGTGISVTGTYPVFTISATNAGAVTSVVGTANQIVITGTTVPTVSIAPTYPGQTSIITVGGVTTGTWSATPVDTNHGGTSGITARGGLNNLLPSQSGNNLKVLQSDGTNAAWASASSFLSSTGSTITITAGTPTNVDINLSKLNLWNTSISWAAALGSALNHLIGPSDQAFKIIGGTPVSPGAGNAVNITASSGVTLGIGGDVSLLAGNAAGTTGSPRGGNINITAGNSVISGATGGGVITLTGGTPTTAGGGAVFVKTANSATTIKSADITIQAGNNGGASSSSVGTVFILGGNHGAIGIDAGGEPGGAVTVTTGAGATGIATASGSGGQGGIFTINTAGGGFTQGNTLGVGGAGGDIVFNPGNGGATTGSGGTQTGGRGGNVIIPTGPGGNSVGSSGTRTGGDAGKVIFSLGASGFGATARGATGTFTIKVGGTVIDSVDSTQQYSSVGLRTGNAFTVTGNTTTTIYAGQTLMTIIIKPVGTETIKVGTTSGAADVIPSTSFTAGTIYTLTPLISTFSTTANQTLFIQGASGSVFYNLKTL